MSELRQLQLTMAQGIRQGKPAALQLITNRPPLSAEERLAIYADAYLLRLDEALRSNYPKLHLLLGDDAFFELSAAYCTAQPSQQASIRWFGDHLAAWLARDVRYAHLPLLAELARFEWALGLAFDAADQKTAGLAVLGQLQDEDWPQLKPKLHPACSLLSLQYNAIAIWQALDREEEPPAAKGHVGSWMIWREQLAPHYRSLATDEAALLQALQQGQAFGDACQALLPWHDEEHAPNRAAMLLAGWLRDGWVVGLGL